MTRVAWHPLARRELLDASAYYDAASEGLGDIFIDAVEKVVVSTRRHPEVGAPLDRQLRRALVPRFPYSLIYRLEGESPRELFILAIAHQKRRPGFWAKRS